MRGFSPIAWAAGFLLALTPFAVALLAAHHGIAGAPCGALCLAIFVAEALFSTIATGLGMAAVYCAKVGGFTGDALGAAVELGEAIFLVVVAASLTRL